MVPADIGVKWQTDEFRREDWTRVDFGLDRPGYTRTSYGDDYMIIPDHRRYQVYYGMMHLGQGDTLRTAARIAAYHRSDATRQRSNTVRLGKLERELVVARKQLNKAQDALINEVLQHKETVKMYRTMIQDRDDELDQMRNTRSRVGTDHWPAEWGLQHADPEPMY